MIKKLLLLLFISSCSPQSEGEKFIDILENRYANLEVNKKEKLVVLDKIKKFVDDGKFKEENILEIKKLLSEMKDYHLVMDSTLSSTDEEVERDDRCITSKIESASTYIIKVHSLWCETEEFSSIDRFSKEFKEHAIKAKSYSNIKIDLRGNGGGGDQETRYLLKRLIKSKSFLYQYQYTNATRPVYKRGFGKWTKKKTDYISPLESAEDYLGHKNLIALVDKDTFSSAEVVASVLKFSKSAILLGERTKGGAGDPITEPFFDGRYELSFATCVVWQEDGSLYEQHGVTPNSSVITK
ncbi:S41 family peptidase [Halobacteriovorax sp.]|uniref:S41 family peptidase n=1 Tax=Halobacteriovorax sp. TaxID=2020862 RepID=UPI00356AE09C